MREIQITFMKAPFPQSRISLLIFVIGASVVLAEFHLSSTTHILIVAFFIFGAFLCFSWEYGMKIATKQMLELRKPHDSLPKH
jgi:membrane-bound ClpP family serine protease